MLDDAILDAMYDAIGNGGLGLLPDLLSRATGGRSCTLQVLGEDFVPEQVHTSYFTAAMSAFYVEHGIYDEDLWQVVSLRCGLIGRATNMSEFVSDDAYVASGFYQKMIRTHGDDTGRCLGLLKPLPRKRMLTIGIHRALRSENFTADNTAGLDRLGPHLARIAEVESRFHALQVQSTTWSQALAIMPQPALVVSPAGMVLFANRAAEALLERGDGLVISGGRLDTASVADSKRLAACLGSALLRTGSRGGAVTIARGEDAPPYRLIALPLFVAERSHALVLIDDPGRPRLHRADYLRALYGLTSAEAQVALLLSAGETAERIAEIRQVTVPTVKTLIQRIYRKTDVTKAVQLARLIENLPD